MTAAPPPTVMALPGDKAPYSFTTGGLPKLSLSRWVYAVAAVFTPLACAGSFFGWFNMVNVLQSEGYFQDQCADGVSGCSAQSLAFNSIYTAASICSFISPICVGVVSTKYGPRIAMVLTAVVFALGAVAIILADTTGSVGLLYVGFICFGISASSMLLPIYNYANMFPGYEGLALGILNGSFDAGSLVYFVMGRLYDSGVSFSTLMIAYLCGPVLILLLNAVFLWRPIPFYPLEVVALGAAPADVGKDGVDEGDAVHVPPPVVIAIPVVQDVPVSNPLVEASPSSVGVELPKETNALAASTASLPQQANDDTANCTCAPVGTVASSTSLEGICSSDQWSDVVKSDASDTKAIAAPVAVAAEVGLQELPGVRQLLTKEWLMYSGFFVVNMLRYNVYIGSVDTQLTSMGQVDSEYSKIFGIIAPLGFFVQFIAGPILDRWGLATSLSIQWCILVLLSALNLIPSLEAQVATFCAFAAFRAFHFVNMTAYMARTFGYRTLGMTIGAVILLGGLFSLLQTVFLLWAFNVPGATEDIGDFTAPNSLLLALSVAVGYFPVWYIWKSRRRAVESKR